MNIAHRLNKTAYYANLSAYASGDQQYGTPIAFKCRIGTARRHNFSPDEETVQPQHKLLTNVAIDAEAIIWLPGANTANEDEAFPVLDVQSADGLAGGGDTIYEVAL
jgi:hypothetical protein